MKIKEKKSEDGLIFIFTFNDQFGTGVLVFSFKYVFCFIFKSSFFDHHRMLSAILYKLQSVITCDFLGSFQPTEGFGLPGYFTFKLCLIFLKDFHIAERGDEDQWQF